RLPVPAARRGGAPGRGGRGRRPLTRRDPAPRLRRSRSRARFIRMFETSVSHAEDDRAGSRPETRERVLDAAERLFAERGFRATSIRDITAAARCNVAAVNYHFGGKVGLYREMFRRRLAALRERRVAGLRS